MKKMVIMFFAALLLLVACDKEEIDICEEQRDINQGLILEVLDIECPHQENGTFVIEGQEAFETLLDGCAGTVPAIDFDKNVVLGITTGASGCERYYKRTVTADASRKEYRYKVQVYECGGCEPWFVRTHWVVVPKPPAGYDYSFEKNN